jgi:hypothetical protein
MQRFEKTKIDFNFPKAVATLNGWETKQQLSVQILS